MDVAQLDGARAIARGLIMAVLGGARESPAVADHVLHEAEALGVDPLDYCAHRLGLGDAKVFERAAHWAGLVFWETVPQSLCSNVSLQRLDRMAEVTALPGAASDRDFTFFAPRFDELLLLAEARARDPAIAQWLCIVPPRAIRTELARACADDLMVEARHRLTRRWPYASANIELSRAARMVFVGFFGLTTVAMAVAPMLLSALLLPFVAVLVLVPALLRLAAALLPQGQVEPVPLLCDADLPVYTILIPLRDEAGMVPQLGRAMRALDYPPEKLDIKFVVEATSPETIAAVDRLLDDPRFQLVVVPDGAPRTKPKALNFALPLARGAHLVVYDAEDIPDRDQLRLAASQFAAHPGFDCLQAELVAENAEENWITALFAAEYAGLFGLMLPFLGRHRLPMPLGGTSNHFRTAALRELGHWDAFNVTEDADLGVRLARLRYNTGTLRSVTSEEAPISLDAWMRQRTRWIKGWMQTFIVHNRSPILFARDIGVRNFLFFEIYVGSLILSSLVHALFIGGFAARIALGHWPDLGNPVDLAYVAILVLGYGGALVLVVAGLVRCRAWHLIPQQLALPLYWLMHSIASLHAAHQLLVRPYFWGKTAHGRTRRVRGLAGVGGAASTVPAE